MKIWIPLAVLAGLVFVGGLMTLIYRNLSAGEVEMKLSNDLARQGLEVATTQGCIACHSLDGSEGIGPSWLGMYGKTEALADGSTVVVDDAYFIESIVDPTAKAVKGYQSLMIGYFLEPEEMEALLEFARQLQE